MPLDLQSRGHKNANQLQQSESEKSAIISLQFWKFMDPKERYKYINMYIHLITFTCHLPLKQNRTPVHFRWTIDYRR